MTKYQQIYRPTQAWQFWQPWPRPSRWYIHRSVGKYVREEAVNVTAYTSRCHTGSANGPYRFCHFYSESKGLVHVRRRVEVFVKLLDFNFVQNSIRCDMYLHAMPSEHTINYIIFDDFYYDIYYDVQHDIYENIYDDISDDFYDDTYCCTKHMSFLTTPATSKRDRVNQFTFEFQQPVIQTQTHKLYRI